MPFALAGLGIALIVESLWEGFETIILPRRVTRRSRLMLYFHRPLWRLWKLIARALRSRKLRETWLSFYGPLSILLVLSVWASCVILGFALLLWETHSTSSSAGTLGGPGTTFFTSLYLSATSFFTLGMGDVAPSGSPGRFLAALESGLGFGFLALLISYLPSLNQSFARREVSVVLLDARAGSPPSAGEMLRRHSSEQGGEALRLLLEEWERWSAEILESHQSYPVLAYFRSQHDEQSWLAAITAILDTCALLIVDGDARLRRQAELTFAIARHTVVDLCVVFRRPPRPPAYDRLPPETMSELRAVLSQAGRRLSEHEGFDIRLAELRLMYEPYVNALASHFLLDTPAWTASGKPDGWQTSEWEQLHRPGLRFGSGRH